MEKHEIILRGSGISGGGGDWRGDWSGLALLIIFCWGDPDLLDALIHFLMK